MHSSVSYTGTDADLIMRRWEFVFDSDGDLIMRRWEFVFDSDAELIMRRWEFVFDSDAVQQYGNMELCCACAWLLFNERELVNLLARGVNIIAFGICKECFTG